VIPERLVVSVKKTCNVSQIINERGENQVVLSDGNTSFSLR
jgi:hypothetical protein